MPTLRYTVQLSGRQEMQQYMERVHDALSKPQGAVRNATNRVALYWMKNFLSEGSLVGGWAPLAESTIANRIGQGYGGGPIMTKSGSLAAAATGFFASAVDSGQVVYTEPYDPRGITVTARLSMGSKIARLSVDGWPVVNQWYGPRTGRPARPFWWVDQAVGLQAGLGVAEWLFDEVLV